MDKSLAKKYTKIAVTLGVIAGGSALLIGLANVITEGPIKQNEINKKLESIKVVYGDNAKYSNEVVISSEHKEAYPHLLSYYNAKDANDKELGNVFVTEGKNQFGAIKMAVGVGTDYQFDKISLIVNEQTLPNEVNSFVDKVNKGGNIDDVKCGATYGATLINEMAKESLSYYKNVILENSGVETRDFLANIFGENSKYGEEVVIENESYKKVKSYYTATSKNDVLLGYVFVAEDANQYGKIKMSVGITTDGKIGKIFLIENQQSYGDKVQGYVDGVNNGNNIDDVACGATFGATTVNGMAKEALTYYKGEIKNEITDFSPYCAQIFKEENTKFIRRNLVIDTKNKNLVEHWTATDKTGNVIGRVYHVDMDGNHFMVGVNVAPANPMAPHTLKGMFWVNAGEDQAALDLIAKVNNGEDIGKPAEADAPLVKAVKGAVDQVKEHAAKNRVMPAEDVSEHLDDVFGGKVSYCDKTIIDDINYPTIMGYWNVKDASRTYIGRVYHMSAPGEHGAMHALVGVKPNNVAGGEFFKVWTNATSPHEDTLNKINDYIKAINETPSKINEELVFDKDTEDSATGGTLAFNTRNGIRNLCLDAVNHYGVNIIADIYTNEVFGNKVSYVEKEVYNDPIIRESWNVLDSENNYAGRVYHVALKGRHATLHALAGFHHVKVTDKEGNVSYDPQLAKVYLVNKAPGVYGDKIQAYVNNLNDGNLSLKDDIHNGATSSSMGLRDIINQAFDHYLANPLLPLLKDMSKLKALYGEDVSFQQHRKISEAAYPNLVEYWNVKDTTGKPIAYAYHCALPGRHAIMEITVSVTTKQVQTNRGPKTVAELDKVYLMNKADNEYGDIVQKYVDSLNDGSISIDDDIHNGATSSCNGIKTMVKQAMEHATIYQLDAGVSEELMNDGLTEAIECFGASATKGKEVAINSLGQDNLLKYWDVTGGDLDGRIYLGSFPGEHGVIHCLVSIDKDGNFKHVVWIDAPKGFPPLPPGAPDWTIYPKAAIAYIEKINSGEININDDVHNGATGTTGGIMTLIHQSLDHFNLNKIGG